jgi:hypothetical protein
VRPEHGAHEWEGDGRSLVHHEEVGLCFLGVVGEDVLDELLVCLVYIDPNDSLLVLRVSGLYDIEVLVLTQPYGLEALDQELEIRGEILRAGCTYEYAGEAHLDGGSSGYAECSTLTLLLYICIYVYIGYPSSSCSNCYCILEYLLL